MALKATPPNLVSQPTVEFRRDDFNASIWNKGYAVQIEKANRCPCEGVDGVAKSDCQNCMGTGYFFINPFQTIALVTGINRNTQFKEWSEELIGTISMSVRDDLNDSERLSFYDRITLVKSNSSQIPIFGTFSEILPVHTTSEGENFVFTTYKIQQILEVWLYNTSTTKLTRIPETDYNVSLVNGFVLNLENALLEDKVISIRYRHDIQYHVIDLPHEIRYSTLKDKSGQMQSFSLPVNAIARRAHLLQVNKPNFDGTGVLDNSYVKDH